jgi:hypothetical protein
MIRYYLIVLVEALTALAYHIARNAYSLEPNTPIQTLRALADQGLRLIVVEEKPGLYEALLMQTMGDLERLKLYGGWPVRL